MSDSSPPAAARALFPAGLAAGLPGPQEETSCEPPKVVRSSEELWKGLLCYATRPTAKRRYVFY